MGSPLFVNSEGFRKKLITRNLSPYQKAPNKPTPPTNYEYIQSDTSVLDSPDSLIDEPTFANKLYPLNQYGNEGGYEQVPDPGSLNNTKSNEGEYGFQDAHILDQAVPESQKWKPLNAFSSGNQLPLDSAPFFESLNLIPQQVIGANNQPYPTTFVSSFYGPASILLSKNPQGSDGLLSQDSFIARLGAETLRKGFEERIATQIIRQTTGRINLFSVDSGTDVLNLITGRVPLIEPNYTITVPANPILAATDFALRLAGSIIPVSTIPGSYFDTSINTRQPTTIQQLTNAFKKTAVGKAFNKVLGSQTGSELFLNNTGAGQKARLFGNLDYNKYKPSYDRTLFDRLAGAIVGSTTNNSNYYIGSRTSEPSRIFSPGGDIPVDSYGREVQAPVYGPQELAQLYEGPSQEVKLGANGPTYSNGGGIEGGFTWVSPKYKDNAGKKVGVGGLIADQDEDFKPSSYNSTESTNREYREGSILDDTQRIITSQPQGGRRLQHVGNAIDQVSKVFHDGYKELTKGSRVLSYVGGIGQEVGSEYCRVFAKDIPYLQYNDLQKTDGITTEGRRFSWSVLDKTYNLNIYPNKQEGGQDSTNLIGNTNESYAKKYMFSLENLAWRTSNRPGYTVSDLAICERGPNGGRVMWFPPYGLTFNENVSASWKSTDFIGRPEPIYTYINTNRTGTLTWKIVVDHPSVLNLIVDKVMKNETNRPRIDSIINSFFAGCRKYDIYELAKKYYTIDPNDLYELQQKITSGTLNQEQLTYAVKTIQSGVDSTNTTPQPTTQPNPFNEYKNYGFYFGNDYPKQGSVSNYTSEYTRYTNPDNIKFYQTKSPSTAAQTTSFFSNVVTPNYNKMQELANLIAKQLKDTKNTTGTVTLIFNASCSAPATKTYNVELADRRVKSSMLFFEENEATKEYVKTKRLLLKKDNQLSGETAQVLQYDSATKKFTPGANVNCTDKDQKTSGGDTQVGTNEIFTTNAMACRRSYISNIVSTLSQPEPQKKEEPTPQQQDVLVGTIETKAVPTQNIETKWVEKDNITKRVLRKLLSECDYFETIKEETPMVFDNLKDKLKFFQPAFHSMTPEGLNTRLTFLQQCMRPGDTIPTVKQTAPGGKVELQYNNAVNTAFGAPPVLVLRVGDFYNTKIIPTSLGITYEDLDINPEGIGIQPMIANITLGFNFVGGSGLKESVDKLQNALTFNYYANTEIYDDRADSTDLSYQVIDKDFLNAIGAQPPGPTVNQTQNNNGQNNNTYIGKVVASTTSGGTIQYKTFMDSFVVETQTYFTNIFNKTKEVFSQYNNAMLQNWTSQRNYTNGNFASDETLITHLIGKPQNLQSNIDTVFSDFVDNIESNNNNTQDRFINYIDKLNFNNKIIRQLKANYKAFVNDKKSSYLNAVTKTIQELSIAQQNYIQYLSRINTIVFNPTAGLGTDGLQAEDGSVTIIDLSGTTSYTELNDDIKKIQKDLDDFYFVVTTATTFNFGPNDLVGNLIWGESSESTDSKKLLPKVFIPFSSSYLMQDQDYLSFRRAYMILSDDVLDDKKYQTFKTALIGNIINNDSFKTSGELNLDTEFDFWWKQIAKPTFKEENDITNEFFNKLERENLKNFLKYTPTLSKSERVFDFVISQSPSNEQKKLITSLNAQTDNISSQSKWNEKQGSVYISKAKLN
jgi:hypothetical protein